VQRVNKYNLHSSYYNKAFITNSDHMRYGVKGQSVGYPEFRGPRDQFERAVLSPDGESWQNRDGVPAPVAPPSAILELDSSSSCIAGPQTVDREIETGANIYGEQDQEKRARTTRSRCLR